MAFWCAAIADVFPLPLVCRSYFGREVLEHFNLEIPEGQEPTEEEEEIRQVR